MRPHELFVHLWDRKRSVEITNRIHCTAGEQVCYFVLLSKDLTILVSKTETLLNR